ncbi:MAG: hypothetical protein ACP5N2_03850 [Candidatus Nanoarchaeia archaeon]
MNALYLSKDLLEVKINDYKTNSGMMPRNARILSKMFAKSLGTTASKIISTYNSMYSKIDDGESVEDIQDSIQKIVNKQSKVTITIPVAGKKQARICGLVALNYSGFFNTEIELYSALMTDLKTNQYLSENIVEASKQVASNNPEKYDRLLQQKKQSIYDFGILMGLVDDNSRFEEITNNMHSGMETYFRKVTSAHKGGKLGISMPLPLKKFSTPIRDNLYRDTIADAIQEGVGIHQGFSQPESETYKKIIEEIKETTNLVASKKYSFGQKWRVAAKLPTTMFFLAGLEAYTPEGLAAVGCAGLSADDSSDFAITWSTWFTLLNVV